MEQHNEAQTMIKKFKRHGRSMMTVGILFILIQVAMATALLIWMNSVWGLLIGFALFSVGKWFIERSINTEYLVTEYSGRTITNEYTTHGTFLGGLLRMAGVVIGIILLEAVLMDYVFPADTFVVQFLYAFGMLWIVLHSVLRDITKIKTGSRILKMIPETNPQDIPQSVQNILDESEEQHDKKKVKLAVVMVGLCVLAILVQCIICWIQAGPIAKKLDMYEVYHAYYEQHDGVHLNQDLPNLTEEWFEEAVEKEDAVQFSRFNTKCTLKSSGTIMYNGVPQTITMEIGYVYTELNGWRCGMRSTSSSVATDEEDPNTGEAIPITITGKWHGIGRDKTQNTSDNNELTIVLDTLTTTEVSGSITCERYGETLYTKTFKGTVDQQGECFHITATYDQADVFYPEISFTYDATLDQIYYIDISPDTKLDRVTE